MTISSLIKMSPSHSHSLPKMCHAFSRYRKYLHSYYNSNPIVCDDKLSIAPCSQFINLALVKRDKPITNIKIHGGKDEIMRKIPVGVDTIVTSDSQFVLVEGPPGIGKSTLCWELCRQWDTLQSLKDYKIVLQLKLRERRVQNASSLQEIFYHDDKALSQSVVKEVFRSEGEGVLLIFDGFDEMPSSVVQDEESLIMRLIHGFPTCLPLATRLVTSRPSAFHYKRKFPRKFRHIEILGFISDESKVRYAKLAFESEPKVLASFKSFVFSNPIIKSLMYIPVNCAIISQVYKDIIEPMPKTMTQLYKTLIPLLIKRYLIEKGKWNIYNHCGISLKDLPKEYVPALNRVSELAYNGLLKEDIQIVFTDSDVGEGFQHLGLLSETKEMYMCEGAVSSYSFLHLSIQEFLAAWHVKCHPEIINKTVSGMFYYPGIDYSGTDYEDIIPYLTTFGFFLAGMIGCDKIEHFMSFKCSFLIMCMYEAQDCSQLTQPSPYTYDIPSNPMEMYAFGYVLVNAPIQWHLCATYGLPPFDILAASLRDHASSEDQIQGSIVELTMSFNYKCLPEHDLLPPTNLLHSITKSTFICSEHSEVSIMSKLLRRLVNVQDLVISLCSDDVDQDDYLLYELLRQLPIVKDLKLSFRNISLKGIEELSTTLSSSCTMEKVKLEYNEDNEIVSSIIWTHSVPYTIPITRSLPRLVEAVLSCSSVTSLETNILFDKLPPQHHIETLIFTIAPYLSIGETRVIFNCLLRIIQMSRMQPMKSLEIVWQRMVNYKFKIPHQSCSLFFAALNDSLYQNPSMCSLSLRGCFENCLKLEELQNIFHKDQQNIRRTKSLSDIPTAKPQDNGGLRRSSSCWTVLSVPNMHPLLYEALISSQLSKNTLILNRSIGSYSY